MIKRYTGTSPDRASEFGFQQRMRLSFPLDSSRSESCGHQAIDTIPLLMYRFQHNRTSEQDLKSTYEHNLKPPLYSPNIIIDNTI